jgi:flavodoxin
MKAIIYASVHHGNTKKVVEAIAKECEVELIDATQVKEKDLSGYDAVGFASGIYYSKFHQSVLNFAAVNLYENAKVFYICTNGGNASYKSIEEIVKGKNAVEIGRFSCKGYDTFGPFKLIGGLAKGHPDDKDLENAVAFFKGLE